MYLQAYLSEWVVGRECNRDGVEPKMRGHLDINPDNEDDEAKLLFADVIVHQRVSRKNYPVIEFKKSMSNLGPKDDDAPGMRADVAHAPSASVCRCRFPSGVESAHALRKLKSCTPCSSLLRSFLPVPQC